jgi:NAD(P)-dependent dehydrogenase (short-subunit alcohol dehydrogenase family)
LTRQLLLKFLKTPARWDSGQISATQRIKECQRGEPRPFADADHLVKQARRALPMELNKCSSVYSLNVKVPYFLVAELAPMMAKRGKGTIVNVSTMVAEYGEPGLSLYASSKAAINLLTKAWAAEYGPSGVRVNTVSPGPIRTEGTESMGEALDQLAAQAPRAPASHSRRDR